MHTYLTIAFLSVNLFCSAEEPAQQPVPETKKYNIKNWSALVASAAGVTTCVAAQVGLEDIFKKLSKCLEFAHEVLDRNPKMAGAYMADAEQYKITAHNLNNLIIASGAVSIAALAYFIYSNYTAYQAEKEDKHETIA